MALSVEEAFAIAVAMLSSIKLQNEIAFGDFPGKAPDIDVFLDEMSFYTSILYLIHLGIVGIVKAFQPKTDADLMSAINYMRGHEEQHVRSTAERPYKLGIQRGCEAILEFISSKEEKSRRRFRSARDYENFCANVLPTLGIYISMPLLVNIVAGIANSLEDGRIERIRASRFPGFEKLRIIHRGIYWSKSGENFAPYPAIASNAGEKLRIITNQILSLSTCQLYQKGFAAAYAGTTLMQEVNDLMPFIARGVMAGRTRDMAAQVVEISKKLAPYIYEVCKLPAASTMFEKIIAQMIKSMVDAMPENTGLSEQNEDTDEGGSSSTFPHSDLVITLDDETYDKLTANRKPGDGNGGLMIRREHPVQPEEEETQTEKAASEQEESREEGEKNSAKSSRSSGSRVTSEEDTDEGGNGSSSQNPASEEKTRAGRSSAGDDAGEENPSDETAGNSAQGKKAVSEEGSDEGGENGSSGQGSAFEDEPQSGASEYEEAEAFGNEECSTPVSGEEAKGMKKPSGSARKVVGRTQESKTESDAEDLIREAMREAAEEMNVKSRLELENMRSSEAHAAKTCITEKPDTSKPVTAEDVKDICPDFTEVRREYKLTERLPAVVAARGRTMLRKNQQYFKSLSTPNVSFLDSGSVDPSRIYGLSFGDTEIFRKKGMDKKFNGCCYILMDNSGSMAGDKRTEACKAAAVIEEGFRGLIPIKIVAFDWTCGGVVHEVIKGWDEQMRLNCSWNFCLKGREGNGNADGYDIQIATRELLQRPEEKKLLVVLSDGMPAEASPGYTKGAIQAARKKGILVNGIYFSEREVSPGEERGFAEMYEKDYICCSLDKVDENLSAILKKFSRS